MLLRLLLWVGPVSSISLTVYACGQTSPMVIVDGRGRGRKESWNYRWLAGAYGRWYATQP